MPRVPRYIILLGKLAWLALGAEIAPARTHTQIPRFSEGRRDRGGENRRERLSPQEGDQMNY